MIFCDKHFEFEFLKVERWVKFIGIPFFTIVSTLFLTPYPHQISGTHLVYHLVFSFLGVIGIWISTRWISGYFRKQCIKWAFAYRLAIQILASCIAAVTITVLLSKVGFKFFHDLNGICEIPLFDFKNLILTVILMTFLIITIYESFYLFVRLSETALETERYKKESIEAQYQNLTSRLNPHFLFNSLNTLTTIVEEDSSKAVAYIQELAVVYRYVLNSHNSTWIDLPAEMKFSQSYITLLKMRFEENLIISMDICEKHQTYCILPLTIQLLIENAVKHNEISSKNPLELKIYCTDEYLIVHNNKQKRMIMPSSTKVGLHNISERYRFLVNREVIIEDTESTFTVKVPLVKITV